MKKMDEMDRNIRLRSEEFGFKTAVFALAIWTLYESWEYLFNSGSYNSLPTLILLVTLCVQGFSEMVMKRKMISDDEEYKEPNRILWRIIAVIATIAILISIGSYLLISTN